MSAVLQLDVATEATVRLGIPASLVFAIGVVELACTLLYLVRGPRRSAHCC
jgi:hypothetical protein